MRTSVWAALALAAFHPLLFAQEQPPGPSQRAASANLLTAEEAREVETLIASVLAAGFPDASKSAARSGKLRVTATFDPAKDPPPLPSTASDTQSTGQNGTTYQYVFDGLHFKLADGSWVIALSYRFKPKAGDTVNDAQAPQVDMAGLTAAAAAAHPFNAEKDAAKWLAPVTPEYLVRAKEVMDRLVPVSVHLKLKPDYLAPAILLLHRAGWSDAAAMSLSIADQRARSYWQLRPWRGPEMAFDPAGTYALARSEEQDWWKAHPQIVPEAPQVALRRALFRWCRAQMTVEHGEDALLPLAGAAAAAKAALDPKDPQGNAARIDALLADMRLPLSPAKDAGLAERLQSWEARERKPRMKVSGGNAGLSIGTSFEAPAPAYVPQKEDLDGLAALLADERPSRFWDFSGPRTLGDNAWRAMATLLKADPRTLAHYAADRPWTAAERREAATAVQLWWKEHRKEYVGK